MDIICIHKKRSLLCFLSLSLFFKFLTGSLNGEENKLLHETRWESATLAAKSSYDPVWLNP